MTELQRDILYKYFPEYENLKDELEQYSDYELNLIANHLPDNIDEIRSAICSEIQWDIIGDVCGPFINDWDNFFFKYEGEIMDYCWDGPFIGYNSVNHSYEISKDTIKDICSELISLTEEDCTLNENVDFSEVIAQLNKWYPVKFCEV